MKKININEDPVREERITMEIVVDAYDEGERAMGWHSYLDDKITFPFEARVVKSSSISPLKKDEIVMALGMADSDDCEHDMFVEIKWNGHEFAVPLEQIYPIGTEGDFAQNTAEAIEDWHYWVDKGYCF